MYPETRCNDVLAMLTLREFACPHFVKQLPKEAAANPSGGGTGSNSGTKTSNGNGTPSNGMGTTGVGMRTGVSSPNGGGGSMDTVSSGGPNGSGTVNNNIGTTTTTRTSPFPGTDSSTPAIDIVSRSLQVIQSGQATNLIPPSGEGVTSGGGSLEGGVKTLTPTINSASVLLKQYLDVIQPAAISRNGSFYADSSGDCQSISSINFCLPIILHRKHGGNQPKRGH